MDVSVRKSPISGKGVFAKRDFRKGEIILEWHPEKILTKSELQELSEEELDRTTRVGRKYFLMAAPERYVNHSCNPNSRPSKGRDIALRDIRKGEEITSDYGLSAPEGWKMACSCHSGVCRKSIKKI